jgi:hypothetical protein
VESFGGLSFIAVELVDDRAGEYKVDGSGAVKPAQLANDVGTVDVFR